MARVLIVEDEDRYREIVAQVLGRRGHEVMEAATGHDAIALGLRHRPEVLVADWMLRHSIHGLHVAESLRVALPSLHTILVTGFPSTDVQVDFDKVGIVEMLEKPFDLERLDDAVRAAAENTSEADGFEVVGVLLVEEGGAIVHRNHTAAALLGETKAGADAARLDEVFDAEALGALESETGAWCRVAPDDSHGVSWWARLRPLPGGASALFLCAAVQEWRRDDPRVRALLGIDRSGESRWEFEDRVLLVDDSSTVRDSFVAQLRSRGCTAYSAGSHEQGLRKFRADPELRVVILDWAMPGEDLRTTVAQLREIRPEVLLIGTSGEDRRPEFEELGIDAFLHKPWTVAGDLAALLGGEARRSEGPNKG